MRKRRIVEPHYTYHIFARNNPGLHYLEHDGAKEIFLDLLSKIALEEQWNVMSYCVMKNHYHLCLQPVLPNLSRGMQRLHTSFAKRIHARSATYGRIFQGRFKSHVIEGEIGVQQVIRYIELNPIRAQIVNRAENYEWSSCRAILGECDRPGFLQVNMVLRMFHQNVTQARSAFRSFLQTESSFEEDLEKQLASEKPITFEADQSGTIEIPATHPSPAKKPALSEFFPSMPMNHQNKSSAIRKAYRAGYTQQEIARHLNVSQPTVSRLLNTE